MGNPNLSKEGPCCRCFVVLQSSHVALSHIALPKTNSLTHIPIFQIHNIENQAHRIMFLIKRQKHHQRRREHTPRRILAWPHYQPVLLAAIGSQFRPHQFAGIHQCMGKAFCLCLRDAGAPGVNGQNLVQKKNPAAKIVELHPHRNEGFIKRIAREGVDGVEGGCHWPV